jgi:hypothetical protein
MQRLELQLLSAVWATSIGVWLGILSRSALDAIDDIYYLGDIGRQCNPIDYRADAHNRRGLWEWEREALDRHFRKGRVAVLGAGGGREVLALKRLGFESDGWECQPDLVRTGNRILIEEGFEPTIAVVPRDTVPPSGPTYSGIIIGWAVYTYVPGSQKRIALLRSICGRLSPGSPILLSFFSRDPAGLRFYVAARVANALRRIAGREGVEVGDFLAPHYVHYFTESEIRHELEAAGFTLAAYKPVPFTHAVATSYERKDVQLPESATASI